MLQLKIAFVGSGYMAREHAKVFKAIAGVTLCGVYGRTQSSAQKFAQEFEMPAIASLDSLYNETKADLLLVAVDELSILDVMKACIRSPWAILMEKPPGYRPQDAEELLSLSEQYNQRCYVALNRRFMNSATKAREQLDANSEKRFITVTDQEDVAEADKHGQPKEVQQHWMYANSIHIIDLLRFFGRGKITDVIPVLRWRESLEASMVVAAIRFDSGDIGLYKGLWNAPGPWMAEIVTGSQRFELRPLESLHQQARGQRKMEALSGHADDTEFKPGLRLLAEHTVRMLRGDAKHEVPTLIDAVESMRLIKKIFEP